MNDKSEMLDAGALLDFDEALAIATTCAEGHCTQEGRNLSRCYLALNTQLADLEAELVWLREAVERKDAALEQLLDDMGEDGLCVCQQAKDEARAALATLSPDNTFDQIDPPQDLTPRPMGYYSDDPVEDKRQRDQHDKLSPDNAGDEVTEAMIEAARKAVRYQLPEVEARRIYTAMRSARGEN